MKKHVFDVGANDGSSTRHFMSDPNYIIHLFEPTKELWINLMQHASPRYLPHCVAVDNSDYYGTFNLAQQSDWGCSSLYEFSDNLNETWPGRTDFVKTETRTVKVITLKNYIDAYNNYQAIVSPDNIITEIEFFHCDTQGNDLNVLRSLDYHIDKIKKGVIEVSVKNPLYKNTRNSLQDAKDFFDELTFFRLNGGHFNDIHGNEANLEFERIS